MKHLRNHQLRPRIHLCTRNPCLPLQGKTRRHTYAAAYDFRNRLRDYDHHDANILLRWAAPVVLEVPRGWIFPALLDPLHFCWSLSRHRTDHRAVYLVAKGPCSRDHIGRGVTLTADCEIRKISQMAPSLSSHSFWCRPI